jgi:uncharacterized protein YdhG (YjbR/CyaY superfamily)
MEKGDATFTTVDEYIATFPEATQKLLQQVRKSIHSAAPAAVEKISYQMPAFFLNRNIVYFAAYKKHIGFYPGASSVATFKTEIVHYKTAKGSIQFPLDQAMPLDLIRRIVKFRLEDTDKKPR